MLDFFAKKHTNQLPKEHLTLRFSNPKKTEAKIRNRKKFIYLVVQEMYRLPSSFPNKTHLKHMLKSRQKIQLKTSEILKTFSRKKT